MFYQGFSKIKTQSLLAKRKKRNYFVINYHVLFCKISFLSQQINDMNLYSIRLPIEFSRQMYPPLHASLRQSPKPSLPAIELISTNISRVITAARRRLFFAHVPLSRAGRTHGPRNRGSHGSWESSTQNRTRLASSSNDLFPKEPRWNIHRRISGLPRDTRSLYGSMRDTREITSAFFFWDSSRGVVFHRGTHECRWFTVNSRGNPGSETPWKAAEFRARISGRQLFFGGICKGAKKKKKIKARKPDVLAKITSEEDFCLRSLRG